MPPYIIPEVDPLVGVWGRPSSTLDWCEENYIYSSYVAEFWNTFSNLAMILPSLLGVWYSLKYSLEWRYLLCFISFLIVGVGSLLFHGTLTYSMQLLDELPMLILAAFMLFALLEMGEERGRKTLSMCIKALLLVAYTTVVSLVYIYINDPTFHEVAYALLVVALTFHGFYNLGKYSQWKYLAFSITSLSIYVLGFVLWNIDNHFCHRWRELRRSTGTVGDMLTQFHAWWHLFAGMGTYMHLIVSSRIRMEHLKHPCKVKYLFGVPYVEVSPQQKSS